MSSITSGDGSSLGLLPGVGRGRGRGRGIIRMNLNPDHRSQKEVDVDEVDGCVSRRGVPLSVISMNVNTSSGGSISNSGNYNGGKSDETGRFADVDSRETDYKDLRSRTISSVTSDTSSVASSFGAPKVVNVDVGFGINVPDRLINQKGNIIPFNVVTVDFSKQVAYVVLDDEVSKKERADLVKRIDEIYSSDDGVRRWRVPAEEKVIKGNVYIVKDDVGLFHRAMVVSTHPKKGFKLVNVDTYGVFIVKPQGLVAYRLTPEIMAVWFQVLACKFCLADSLPLQAWAETNHFILRNSGTIESVLLSTMDVITGAALHTTNIKKEQLNGKDLFRLAINIFESVRLKYGFMHSLMYYTVPRVPAAGNSKIAFITNIRENDAGCIDVVFCDHLYYEVQQVLNTIQIKKKLFTRRCSAMSDFFREMICGYNVRHFMAPFGNDWTELHRVKITGLQSDESAKAVTLHFMDSGKQTNLPLNDLRNLAIPMNAKCVPELLEMIPAQAITLRINNIRANDAQQLVKLRQMLENTACYVKSVDEVSQPPLVEIFTTFQGKMAPLIEVIRSGMTEEERKIEGSPEEIRKEEKRRLDLQDELQNFNVVPLKRFEEKLTAIRKKGKDQIEAAMMSSLTDPPCECCGDSMID